MISDPKVLSHAGPRDRRIHTYEIVLLICCGSRLAFVFDWFIGLLKQQPSCVCVSFVATDRWANCCEPSIVDGEEKRFPIWGWVLTWHCGLVEAIWTWNSTCQPRAVVCTERPMLAPKETGPGFEPNRACKLQVYPNSREFKIWLLWNHDGRSIFPAVFWYTPETVQTRQYGPEPPPRQAVRMFFCRKSAVCVCFLCLVSSNLDFDVFDTSDHS